MQNQRLSRSTLPVLARRSGLMCAAALGALALSLGTVRAEVKTSPKFIKITNDSTETVFPIIYIGKTEEDNWLQAKFQVSKAGRETAKYARTFVYRTYVGTYTNSGGKLIYNGLAPRATVFVQAPFYSTLVQNPVGTAPDNYVDWWNGGRVFIADVATQIAKDFEGDAKHKVELYSNNITQCAHLNAAQTTCITPTILPVFSATVGFPVTDDAQLTEYTFADAITAEAAVKKNGGVLPLQVGGVGYNISSVDQTYLPVAMEPLGNPLIPYIGTTIDVTAFRTILKKFLADTPGWPVYLGAGGEVDAARPRIPSAYNVFASANILTPTGLAVETMANLFTQCTQKGDTSAFCGSYRTVNQLFEDNRAAYLKLACHDPDLKYTDALKISKIYGWVAYDETCPAGTNSLLSTAGNDIALKQLQATYIHDLQHSRTEDFNPYVRLIQGKQYLDEAAYAFSVDDEIAYQHYNGIGLVIDIAGAKGLPNPNKLDKKNQVTINPGEYPAGSGLPLWKTYSICSNSKASAKGKVDNSYPSLDVWPQSYPCQVNYVDNLDRPYQYTIKTGPNPGPMTLGNCSGPVVKGEAWCPNLYVNPEKGKQNNVQMAAPSKAP